MPGIRTLIAAALLVLASVSGATSQATELRVEIHEPTERTLLATTQTSVEVVGSASIYGGVKALDLFLVVDSSESLRRTDREDHRTAGIVNLVRSLHPKSNIHLGVVDFDRRAKLLSPLTADRDSVVAALEQLDQKGETNIAAGIQTALEGFAERGRVGASRVILLFTDGKSDEAKALAAMEEARVAGVAVHTLLLGGEEQGEALLRSIAKGTEASFVRVTDPTSLRDAFLNLRTTGVEIVTLRVNGGPPIDTRLLGGAFTGRVPLRPGMNHIEARATSLGGSSAETSIELVVSGPLRVAIVSPGDGSELEGDASDAMVRGIASTWDAEMQAAAPPGSDLGVREVWLRVNDGEPIATELISGHFEARVALANGENRVVALATSLDGRTAEHAVTLSQRSPGCAELKIQALHGDQPALSISDRAIELVFDASNSMWGRMQGEPKISVAKRILTDALGWLPQDLALSLRVYGHQQPHAKRHCQDSELLVPFGPGSRDRIRAAIGSFKARGQTPLAYSLQQIAADFGSFRGERAVVLVTDGIESCDGDPVAAARALQSFGPVPVHVIGFGLAGGNEDTAGLRAIALASGGRFFSAGSAAELREALAESAGTPFAVRSGTRTVARGTLGASEPIQLPEGSYSVHLESSPAFEVQLSLAGEQGTTLLLKREGRKVFHAQRTEAIEYALCEIAAVPEASQDEGIVWEELPDVDPAPAAASD